MIVFIIIFIIEVINYDKINGIFIWFIKKIKLLDLMLINILIYKVFFLIIYVFMNKIFFFIEIFKLLVKLLMYILI